MTARPIRRNAQTPDRNGKIFYTSTTSLSHISKRTGVITLYILGEVEILYWMNWIYVDTKKEQDEL